MINGYITYNELKIITGFDDEILRHLLLQGMSQHQLEVNVTTTKGNEKTLQEQVFNLQEVENWLRIHIY